VPVTFTRRIAAEQLVESCNRAGFRYGQGLDVIVAIARAESPPDGLFEDLVVPEPPTPQVPSGNESYSPWGINKVHLLPGIGQLVVGQEALDYMGRAWTKDDLFVLDHAAKAAFIISRHGDNFTPWTTFNQRLYVVHMAMAQAARRSLETEQVVRDQSTRIEQLSGSLTVLGNKLQEARVTAARLREILE
jgi:hypothetical protein